MTSKSDIDRILAVFQKYNTFVLTSHINPDGDGLGSELALYHYLRNLGKVVRVINASPVPAQYRFMDPDETIFNQYEDSDYELIQGIDVIVVLDISVMHRLGVVSQAIKQSNAIRLCIDHHLRNNFDADTVFVDEEAVATGELIFNILERGNYAITPAIAKALYVALLTDTGCFRFSNTNTRALQFGANLLKHGADHQKEYREIYENDSWEKTELFARTLMTIEKFADGKVAVMHISRVMLEESGANYDEIEGFTEYPRKIHGVLVSILFVEQETDNIKMSFRSSNNVPVDKLAGQFKGGGHKNASAAILHSMTLDNAKDIVTKAAIDFVKNY